MAAHWVRRRTPGCARASFFGGSSDATVTNETSIEAASPMKSIRHALGVLMLFSDVNRPLSVTEVARALKLHKSSASRILLTLLDARFVERHRESGKYSLGLGILSLSGSVLARYQLPSTSRRDLEDLAEQVQETVTVSGWNGCEAVNLDQIFGGGSVVNMSPPGRTNPAHCTATGKVFMAYLDRGMQDELLAQALQRFTAKTITNPMKLRAELQRVRTHGYALNEQEFDVDVDSIAAPVFNSTGAISYVIAVTLPHFRYDAATRGRLAEAITATAKSLSARLGYVRPVRSELLPEAPLAG